MFVLYIEIKEVSVKQKQESLRMRRIVTISIAILVLVAVGLYLFNRISNGKLSFFAASNLTASMELSPSSGTHAINDEFDVAINVDTGGASTNVASAVINYDSTALEAESVTKGPMYATQVTNNISAGRINFDAMSDGVTPVSGPGVLAIIKFKALANANPAVATISFAEGSTDLDHSAVNEQVTSANILGNVRSGSYVIGDTPTPTPSVTVAISPTATIAITPKPTPTSPTKPSVTVYANNTLGSITIGYNSFADIKWTSSKATSCSASGTTWTGTKPLNGSEGTGNLTATQVYTMTCTNKAGSTSSTVTVNVSAQVTPTPTASTTTYNPTPPPPIVAIDTPTPPIEEVAPTPDISATIILPVIPEITPTPLIAGNQVQPWVQWVFYAVIPLILTLSILLYYILRKRSESSLDWSNDKDFPNYPI